MTETNIHRAWQSAAPAESFRTGVSLHSHTLHSKESLDFIYKVARHSAALAWVMRKGEAEYRRVYGTELDLRRGWWTPPLAPSDAYRTEAGQIAGLGLSPIVSLSDHDDIEAPMSLQAMDATRRVPVSVEWTVPFRETFFHIGVHNLPAGQARPIMLELQAFTAAGDEKRLRLLLQVLANLPDTLVIFNHPLWDEKGIGDSAHRILAREFMLRFGRYIHAVELNGLRPWRENRSALRFGAEFGLPVVAGGDRHTLEPNVVLNLTNAATFPEFAAEIRQRKHSNIWMATAYRHCHSARIFHNMIDVFRTYDDHGLGWSEWTDRVFFRKDDDTVTSLTQSWGDRLPGAIGLFGNFMKMAGQPRLRAAINALSPRREEAPL